MRTLETGRMVIHCLSSISTQWLEAASSENCQRYPKAASVIQKLPALSENCQRHPKAASVVHKSAGLPGDGQCLSLFVTGRALDSYESLVVEIVDAGSTGIGE
jgi:hypothetical protein